MIQVQILFQIEFKYYHESTLKCSPTNHQIHSKLITSGPPWDANGTSTKLSGESTTFC